MAIVSELLRESSMTVMSGWDGQTDRLWEYIQAKCACESTTDREEAAESFCLLGQGSIFACKCRWHDKKPSVLSRIGHTDIDRSSIRESMGWHVTYSKCSTIIIVRHTVLV